MKGSSLPDLGPEFSPELVELVRLAVTAAVPDFWSPAERDDARVELEKRYGRVPTLVDIASRYDGTEIRRVADSILQKRGQELLRMARERAEQAAAARADRLDVDAPIRKVIEFVTVTSYPQRFSTEEVAKARENLEMLFGSSVPTMVNLAERLNLPQKAVFRISEAFLAGRDVARNAPPLDEPTSTMALFGPMFAVVGGVFILLAIFAYVVTH